MDHLTSIAHLSQEFGIRKYVRGSGGNASFKDAHTLWIKPSGMALADMKPDSFLAIDRSTLSAVYQAEPPADPHAREAMIQGMMQAAVRPGCQGRPSVETPVHDSFEAAYVVHTHPSVVNGMTCARWGKDACTRLFPDALWVEYTDPGYCLSMTVREALAAYRGRRGHDPVMVFLRNHGVFVAGQSPSDIRAAYVHIIDVLTDQYRSAGISTELGVHMAPDLVMIDFMIAHLREHMGKEEVRAIRAAGSFTVIDGPLTPDHVVYARAYPLVGKPTDAALRTFKAAHGYLPRIIANEIGVFAVGPTEKAASLALELAQDGALVSQLAQVFGGVEYMSDDARNFIEHWEAEHYRHRVST